jgi:hypothetical protein
MHFSFSAVCRGLRQVSWVVQQWWHLQSAVALPSIWLNVARVWQLANRVGKLICSLLLLLLDVELYLVRQVVRGCGNFVNERRERCRDLSPRAQQLHETFLSMFTSAVSVLYVIPMAGVCVATGGAALIAGAILEMSLNLLELAIHRIRPSRWPPSMNLRR